MDIHWCVLGPVEIAADGRRETIGSDRRRTLLAALLAARGQRISTERLIEAVWADDPPPSARKSLRSHVARLRGEIAAVSLSGAAAVVTEPGAYRLAVADGEVDAARFEMLVGQARFLASSQAHRAVELLEEAEGLWRGPAFGELADHEVVRFEATRLEGLRASATAERIEALLSLGRQHEVVDELEARLAAQPLDERACAQLMLALYRTGRQADALDVYRATSERLRDELGVDPSPMLASLHERVLRQETGLAAPDVGERPGSSRTPRELVTEPPRAHALPLLGRARDVREVTRLLSEGPLVTLTGPGGVGKTRLAEHVALEVVDGFTDGVATARLASVGEPGGVGVALLDALGVPHPPGRAIEDALSAAMGDRRRLLVIDDCEYLLPAVSSLVASQLRRCAGLTVLVTSREPLRLPGERLWQVGPLEVPPADADAARVIASPAGRLFCARAVAVEPTFELTDADAATIATLCRRLDGMPLAIELAAARVRSMGPDDLLDRLSDRFAVLTGGPPVDGGRHRTLQAVTAWSYGLLDEAEALLFDRLSVFAGPFSLWSAEQVCAGGQLRSGEVAGVLSELVDKSMVTVERSDGRVRYRLLDTLRDFGAARLEASGDAARWRLSHARHHVALAERIGPRMRGPDEPSAAAEIATVADDLWVAHERLTASGDLDGALRLPTALCDYVILRLRDEMITLTERALRLPGAADHPAYPSALGAAAVVAHLRAEFARARERAHAVLEDDERGLLASVRALTALRVAGMFEGRFADVLALDDAAAEVTDALDDDYYRTYVGIQGLLSRLYAGDGPAARAQAPALEATAEASGSPSMRAWAAYCHGEALMDTAPAEAVERLERSLSMARAVGSYLPTGAALVSLASLRGRLGESERALALFDEAIRHWWPLGNERHLSTALRNLVEELARIGADEPAARLHGAVTPPSAPRFGAEGQRLDAAWEQLCGRLGADTAQAAADRGRELTLDEAAEEALATIATLLER